MTTIRTARLDLVAATVEHLRAELEGGGHRLSGLLGARVLPSWPPGEYDRDALEYFLSRLEQDGSSHPGWYGWYVMTRQPSGEPDTLVAAAGYMGPPDGDGMVEIGYSVVPESRGAGYATEIVSALVRHAFESGLVKRVAAETAASNAASRGVLDRNGFVAVGAGREPDVVRYETRAGIATD